MDLSVIGIIGIILLIGIVKKNGIMMVDFAIVAERDHHMPPIAAIREASQLLTLYTTPVVYLYLDRVQVWLRGDKLRRQPEPERLRVVAAE